jgi:lipopolysaccharide transport system ATP-binding protein
MKPILEIQKISKKYRIQHLAGGYLSFRERMLGLLHFEKREVEDFWPLTDISFDVQPGESIGIIGRNGAGKSTLLKILSKIIPPTKGRIICRGRIASLLEVGTGFHPELTGRENVFFNGSLLGMKQREIESRFDEIVDFSGTEKFLDTPLKHYSSGMQLRLAFSVAAFLDPEILIIDEVLAVGDAEFQRKCLGKMENVTQSGRTILFVSHNMGMVKQLCKKSIWIDKGRMMAMGETDEITNRYLFQGRSANTTVPTRHLGGGVTIENIVLEKNPMTSLTDTQISFGLTSEKPITIDSIGFYLNSIRQERVGIIDLRKNSYTLNAGEKMKMRVTVRQVPLIEGEYKIGLFLGSNVVSGNFDDLISLQVVGPQRKKDTLEYPLEVRGKLEFDYDFYTENN